MRDLIDRAEDLAARCIPPAAGIIRELIETIQDQQRELDSLRSRYESAMQRSGPDNKEGN